MLLNGKLWSLDYTLKEVMFLKYKETVLVRNKMIIKERWTISSSWLYAEIMEDCKSLAMIDCMQE